MFQLGLFLLGSFLVVKSADIGLDSVDIVAAVEANDIALVRELLAADASVTELHRGTSALHQAVLLSRPDALEVLMAHTNTLDIRDERGRTPLLEALMIGDFAVARTLVQAGAGINMASYSGFTPLHAAVMHNACIPFLEEFRESGIFDDIQAIAHCGASGGSTPLHMACQFASPAVIDFLIQNGADVNSPNEDGATPLHVIFRNADRVLTERPGRSRHLVIAQFLCQRGADLSVVAHDGTSVFAIAQELPFRHPLVREIPELANNLQPQAQEVYDRLRTRFNHAHNAINGNQ